MRVLLATAAALVAAGCGGERKQEPRAQEAPAAPVSYFHVDPGAAATLQGRVTYKGPKPAARIISMDEEPGCQQMHAGKPVYDTDIVLGKDGGVANVFVYIKTGLEGKTFEPPKEQVVLDQQGCIFVPRVVGLQAGQPLAVRNSDMLHHNVHPGPKNNREWNEGMAAGAADIIHRFARQEMMIRVKCDVHPWMRSWLAVMEHPYFTVTGADGSFKLKDIPPGDYSVGAWQEKLGELNQPVSFAPSSSQSLDFTYSAGAGGR